MFEFLPAKRRGLGKAGNEVFHSNKIEKEGGHFTLCSEEMKTRAGFERRALQRVFLSQILNQLNSRERQVRNGNINFVINKTHIDSWIYPTGELDSFSQSGAALDSTGLSLESLWQGGVDQNVCFLLRATFKEGRKRKG